MHDSAFPDAGHLPAAVAYRVPELAIVQVAGNDALKVIGGLCTAKLTDVPEGGAAEAFFTDDRGRVLAHAIVAHASGGAWIVGQIPAPPTLAAHIDRFIFREDAAPRDVTAANFARLVDGPEALRRLAAAAGQTEDALRNIGYRQLSISGLEIALVHLPITSPGALLCVVPAAEATQLDTVLVSAGISLQDDVTEFETRRVANFWPLAGREIGERTLPQELDRDARAISFTKGCYLGQETVARLDALGEVQKKLCLIRLTSDQAYSAEELPAALMADDKEVGKLTSLAPLSQAGSRLGLALMRRGSFAVGSTFSLNGSPGQVVEHP